MRLGEAQILLPAMLVCALWLALRARWPALALAWLLLTGLGALVTTASKIGFLGFALGYAPLDYTGVSGHALFATATLPVLMRLGLGPWLLRQRWRASALGLAVAAVVSYGRVHNGLHSGSEALLGFAMGAFASLWPMARFGLPAVRVPLWMPVFLGAWVIALSFGAPPSRTHDWVTSISMQMSGRALPYRRWEMRDAYLLRQQRRLWVEQQLLRRAQGHPTAGAVRPHGAASDTSAAPTSQAAGR